MSPGATGFAVPGWRLDYEDYVRICRHLGLTSSESIYPKLTRYLRIVSAQKEGPVGFGLWLAETRAAPLPLSFLDVWTRFCFRSNPWRYKFNAVIALHECDSVGFGEMSAPAYGPARVWGALALSVVEFIAAFSLGAVWLVLQSVLFLLFGLKSQRSEASFSGRTALVTGASRGIGLQLTCRLIGAGARVIALARRQDGLDVLKVEVAEAGQSAQLLTVAADLAVPGAVSSALAAGRIGAENIDLVFVNAGVKEPQVGELDVDGIRRTFAVNVFGAAETVQALLPAWIRRGSGCVVFISSLGRWHGMVSSAGYNSSKAALSILADSLALDLAQRDAAGIQVTTVEPGLVRTELVGEGVLQGLLSVTPHRAAQAILQGVATRRRHHRFPALFTLLTVALSVAPRWLRARILSRVREGTP